jgi:hypothetical protein
MSAAVLIYPKEKKGLLRFYENYFSENGWADTLDSDVKPREMLNYKKGRKEVNISLSELADSKWLHILCFEFKYTRDEFDALIDSSSTDEVIKLLERVKETYKSLKTYSDIGELEEVHNGELLSKIRFSTKYRNSGRFLFEYTSGLPGGYQSSGVLEQDGDSVKQSASFAVGGESDDIGLAIQGYYGVSRGTSGNVPELLFDLKHQSLFRLINMKLIKEKNIGSIICIRIEGEEYVGEKNVIWIGKDDYLIRKIESRTDDENYSITTYDPKINIPIPDEAFEFREPEED